MSKTIKITNTVAPTDTKVEADPMTKVHRFSVITDGVAKTVEASAMGPIGTGERIFDGPVDDPLLTVAEQKALRQ